jgi:hypothetical protein
MTTDKQKGTCVHSRVCRFRFVSDPDCTNTECPSFTTTYNKGIIKRIRKCAFTTEYMTPPGMMVVELKDVITELKEART